MGREIKRVATDFSWPLKTTWQGYLNPHYKHCHNCVLCGGSGYSEEANRFKDEWYGNAPFDPVAYGSEPALTLDSEPLRRSVEAKIRWADELVKQGHDQNNYYTDGGRIPFATAVAVEVARMFDYWRKSWSHQLNQADVDALLAAERLWDFTRVPRNAEQQAIVEAKVKAGGNSWLPEDNGYRPTAHEVNEWSMFGMGHDGVNQSVCVRARCEREGVPVTCHKCDGDGSWWDSEVAKQASEAWERTEPPAGDGWQLWETTTEGSPVSPVFVTPEELSRWLADTGASAFGGETLPYESWLAFCGKGWAPSMVGIGGQGLMSGVKAVAEGV